MLLPFGGHKGSALMLACEVLGRLLSGSDAYAEPVRGGDGMKYQGVTFMLFRADLFQSIADFTSSMTAFQQEVRAIPPADGFDEVVVPGDLEARARADRRANGLPLPDDVWEPLVETAASLDVTESRLAPRSEASSPDRAHIHAARSGHAPFRPRRTRTFRTPHIQATPTFRS